MAINSLNASSHGFSGLVSGINSQEMVEKMLTGTQNKIDKAGQKKTTLQYKQAMYREVAAKMRALQSSFLSFTSKSNLRSNSFYNTMNATIIPPAGITNPAFSATATSSAQAGTVKVDYIQQLARAYSMKTAGAASGAVEGAFNQQAATDLYNSYTGVNATLQIKIGDKTTFVSSVTTELAGKTSSEVADYFTQKFAAEGIEATAVFENNKLNIIAKNSDDMITIKSSDSPSVTDKSFALQMFGSGKSVISGKGSVSSAIDTDNYMPALTVNLDGREQTIRVDLAALKDFKDNGTTNLLVQNLSDSLSKAFGTGVSATATMVDGKAGISFTSGNTSQHFSIGGNYLVTKTLGIKAGISKKLNPNLAIGDLNFKNELLGNKQTFTINGVSFSYDSKASLTTIMNDINNSKAGVKVTYLESEDKFVIENSEAGAGRDKIDIQQIEGNLLSNIFGVKGGSAATGLAINKQMQGATLTNDEQTALTEKIKNGGSFTFNVNGRDIGITVAKKKTGEYTLEEFNTALNTELSKTFGKTDNIQNVAINYSSGSFSIKANDGYVVKATGTDDKSITKLGFTKDDSTLVTDGNALLNDSNIAFGDGTIQFTLGGTTVTLNGSELDGQNMNTIAQKIQDSVIDTITQEMTANGKSASEIAQATAKVKVTFDSRTSGFNMAGIEQELTMDIVSGSSSQNLNKLFGTNEIGFYTPANATAIEETTGLNAKLSINGTVLERSSNNFTYEGIAYSLNRTTEKTDNGTTTLEVAGEISIARDTQQIVDGLKDFFKMYNETVDLLDTLYRAEPTYKKYPPLTSKQIEAMSDREIERWESQSKEGLLRGDAILESVMGKMRSALYNKPDGSSIAIYDIGISAGYFSKGKFEIEDEGKLKAAIESDPEAIRRLFAGENGLMEVLDGVISDATRISSGSPGSLVSMAGSNVSDYGSKIAEDIKSIDNQLSSLEKKYWSEYNRYWKQFNSMESLIQKMNTQSSWLSQQITGMQQ